MSIEKKFIYFWDMQNRKITKVTGYVSKSLKSVHQRFLESKHRTVARRPRKDLENN